MKTTKLLSVLIVAGLFCSQALALTGDRDKPIEVQADHFLGDEIKQTAVYTGNVQVDQGSMRLTGQKLTLVEKANGYRTGTLTGSQATFRQQRDPRATNIKEWVKGRANQIHYEERTGIVTLTGNAVVEREVNGVVQDSAKGSKIVYDTIRSRTIIQGSQGGRATTVIAPRSRQ